MRFFFSGLINMNKVCTEDRDTCAKKKMLFLENAWCDQGIVWHHLKYRSGSVSGSQHERHTILQTRELSVVKGKLSYLT